MPDARNLAMRRGSLFCLAVVLIAGCGPDLGRPATVTGKVTVDGQPLSGATVMLHCQGERQAEFRTFRATTDSNGQYLIEKVYPGSYEVVVVETGAKGVQEGMQSANPDRLTPAVGSEMHIEVKSEKVVFDLPLKRQKTRG